MLYSLKRRHFVEVYHKQTNVCLLCGTFCALLYLTSIDRHSVCTHNRIGLLAYLDSIHACRLETVSIIPGVVTYL